MILEKMEWLTQSRSIPDLNYRKLFCSGKDRSIDSALGSSELSNDIENRSQRGPDASSSLCIT